MQEKDLTKKHKVGKLEKYEKYIKSRSLTGQIILYVNCYHGGVSDIQEFNKIETNTE